MNLMWKKEIVCVLQHTSIGCDIFACYVAAAVEHLTSGIIATTLHGVLEKPQILAGVVKSVSNLSWRHDSVKAVKGCQY
jgi:hypothetical protein